MLEDVATDAELCERELRQAGLKITWRRVERREEFERALAEFSPHLVLSDFSMPTDFDGLAALDLTSEKTADIPFVFVSGTIGEERAVEAMKRGATDYVLKDRLSRLVPVVKRALQEAEERLARKRTAEALRESEYRLDLALEASGLATWEWNLATGEVRFSRHWWPILGYGPDEIPLRVEAWEKLTHPDDLERVKSALTATVKGAVPVLDIEYRMRAKRGEWRWIRTVGRVVERDAAARALRQTGTHGDVTERKLQELKIGRLNRVLAVLSGINSAIVRLRNRQQLFEEACRIAVEQGEFGTAWIGVFDPATEEVTPVAWRGVGTEGIGRYRATARAGVPQGGGSVGRAIRERKPVFSNDIAAEPDVGGGLRNRMLERGYRSVISLPLLVEDAVTGVLVLFAREQDFFNGEELKLLTELAGDISFALEFIGKEEKLNYLAYYDALTGLPNRPLFIERLGRWIQAAKNDGRMVAAAMLDIERFRAINDAMGRHAGDALLRDLGRRLGELMGEESTVARFSADHFALCLPGSKDVATVAYALEIAVSECTSRPFRVGEQDIRIAVRCGVALYPSDAVDPEALFHHAEIALRRAKESGERMVFYAPEMNARVGEHLKLENELRVAVLEEQFVLHYQPRVDLKSGRITGVEALIRWLHPERGLVPPGEFIPVLEDTGLILEVGRWAIRRAVADCAACRAEGVSPPRVAVNVSALQLRRKEFVGDVKAALAAAGSREMVDIELTESMLMADVEGNIGKLAALRELGVQIAIDDFGTGYSSLSYLARLPIHSLKIDRSFVIQMAKGPEQMAIVSTVISLARALNIKAVAEGVETEEQANLLRLLQCDEAQGYLFWRPMPREDVARLFQ
jgi:diguanylate cyclase (GGDEF)-like protein/PAS domain S-box-containing protein